MTTNTDPRHLLWSALVVVAMAATSTSTWAHPTSTTRTAKKTFGPWDAGPKRKVTRQHKEGLDRHAHPMVGAASKVPGDGPPMPPLRQDPDIPEGAIGPSNRVGSSLSSNPLWLWALTYRHFITRIDGPKCGHYPTCSRLANQAVARYGVLGIFIGLDRIIQPPKSSELRDHPQVVFPEMNRAFDPLSNYEFWKPEFNPLPLPTDEEPLQFDDDTGSPPAASSQTPAAPQP